MNEDDSIKLLILTDNHLGYAEKDAERSNDSFETFEECLQTAKKLSVDAILHVGDLFHENKPSRKTLTKTIQLLKQYCLGDAPCRLQYCSDPKVDFGTNSTFVNWEDPNVNVSIPVFAIHGNHDDPVGDGNLSAWDILAATGLVNYFGKCSNLENLRISPILLKKGNTKLALYGIGNIRDERLHRLFAQSRISYAKPDERPEEWFNMLLLHQNRVPRSSTTSYIPERFIDRLFDLVIWGHEHQSIIEPTYVPLADCHIIQPGSSVATSLCDSESDQKWLACLNICQKKFVVAKCELFTQRVFIMRDICVPSDLVTSSKELFAFLKQKIYDVLREEGELIKSSPKLPLLRLRIEMSHLNGNDRKPPPVLHPRCFGDEFDKVVANPNEILLFIKRKKPNSLRCDEGSSDHQFDCVMSNADVDHGASSSIQIEKVIEAHLATTNQKMDVFTCEELFEKIQRFVEKDDKDAMERWIETKLKFLNFRIKGAFDLDDLKASIKQQNTLFATKIFPESFMNKSNDEDQKKKRKK